LFAANAEAQFTQSGPVWDGVSVPITIEVSQDTPVGPAYCAYMHPKTLCTRTEFTIERGQRFRMIEMLHEGECRIEFQGAEYQVSSCPWTPGFRSGLSDGFVIVQFQNR
jgi:hypothetical protein